MSLHELAPHLPEILSEVLESARAIQSENYRAVVLSGLTPKLKPSSFNFSLWKESLRVLARRERRYLLRDISALSPVIVALGGDDALVATACAIQDVGQQWS